MCVRRTHCGLRFNERASAALIRLKQCALKTTVCGRLTVASADARDRRPHMRLVLC